MEDQALYVCVYLTALCYIFTYYILLFAIEQQYLPWILVLSLSITLFSNKNSLQGQVISFNL